MGRGGLLPQVPRSREGVKRYCLSWSLHIGQAMAIWNARGTAHSTAVRAQGTCVYSWVVASFGLLYGSPSWDPLSIQLGLPRGTTLICIVKIIFVLFPLKHRHHFSHTTGVCDAHSVVLMHVSMHVGPKMGVPCFAGLHCACVMLEAVPNRFNHSVLHLC